MKTFIGYRQALEMVWQSVPLMDSETLDLDALAGHILARDVFAMVDSPSVHASLKDGYAVIAEDVETADEHHPVVLAVVGQVTAGRPSPVRISRGQAMKITTGAALPAGAGAVLAEEFCSRQQDKVICRNTAEAGRNVLRRGSDMGQGETVAYRGQRLTAPVIGLLAAAGLSQAAVYRRPRVCVIATGDELVAPGMPLPEGKLYASNLAEICAWLTTLGISFATETVADEKAAIAAAIRRYLPVSDAFITIGGAWQSERDLILGALTDMQWEGIFHRVRIGPGKGTGFGLLGQKPVFCLPGGPPSMEIALLQLALPGLWAMQDSREPLFPTALHPLAETIRGTVNWTQFIHARRVETQGQTFIQPLRIKSRLRSMAEKDGWVILPEGRGQLDKGEMAQIQLTPAAWAG
jgi:molybdopterin molybdotransferase